MSQPTLSLQDIQFLGLEDNWLYGPVLEILCCFQQNPSAKDVSRALSRTDMVRGPYKEIEGLLADKVEPDCIQDSVVSYCLLFVESAVLGAKLFFERRCQQRELYLWIPPQHVKRVSAAYPWDRNVAWIDASVLSLFVSLIGLVREIHRQLPLKRAVIEDEAYMINPPDEIEGIVVAEDFAGPPGYLGARKYRIPDCPQPERHHSFAIIDL